MKYFQLLFNSFRNAETPLICKRAARKYEKEFEGKWQKQRWENGYKDYVMRRALVYKFSQNRDMLERLVATGNAKLVERSDRDPYWGGLLPNSLNKLGNFLMELRDNYVRDNAIYLDGCDIERIPA